MCSNGESIVSIPKVRVGYEFQEAVVTHGIRDLEISECTVCGGVLKYLFDQGKVYSHVGCYCVVSGLPDIEQSWETVANFYNRNRHVPEWSREMLEYFHL